MRAESHGDPMVFVRDAAPAAKLSDALMTLARPMIESSGQDANLDWIIRLVTIGWNIAVLLNRVTLSRVAAELARIGAQNDATTSSDMAEAVFRIAIAKRALFAHDRRIVRDYQITRSGEEYRLAISSQQV